MSDHDVEMLECGTFLIHSTPNDAGVPIPLQNPITEKIYANGVIPAADQTAFAKAVLAALPLPNNGAATGTSSAYSNNFSAFPRGTINDDKGDARLNHTFSPKLIVFGIYSQHQTAIFAPPTFGGLAGGNANANVHLYNRQIAFGVTYVYSLTSLFDFRMGIGHNEGGKSPYGLGSTSLLTSNGITNGIPTDPLIVRALNAQSVTGFSQFGTQPASPQFQNPSVINPKGNYTLVHGKQSMKIGYEYQAINTQINDYNPSYGQDNYGGGYAGIPTCTTPPAAPVSPCTTANPTDAFSQSQEARNLADFMFGNRTRIR